MVQLHPSLSSPLDNVWISPEPLKVRNEVFYLNPWEAKHLNHLFVTETLQGRQTLMMNQWIYKEVPSLKCVFPISCFLTWRELWQWTVPRWRAGRGVLPECERGTTRQRPQQATDRHPQRCGHEPQTSTGKERGQNNSCLQCTVSKSHKYECVGLIINSYLFICIDWQTLKLSSLLGILPEVTLPFKRHLTHSRIVNIISPKSQCASA